jgi:hypothetical protein
VATYKSTVDLRCWKQHCCVRCGCLYRYEFNREVTGQGSSPEEASHSARNSANQTLQKDVDQKPCPSCGIFQPEMVARRRVGVHGWLIAASVTTMVLAGIFTNSPTIGHDTLAHLTIAAVAVIGLAHVLTSLSNPNKDLAKNRAAAKQQVEAGTTHIDEPGSHSPQGPVPGAEKSFIALVAFVLLAASVVGASSAEARRTAASWPLNPDFYPPVVGPGDTARLFFPAVVQSVNGNWAGYGEATISNAEQLGMKGEHFQVTSQTRGWSSTMHAKSSEKASSSTIYADIGVPTNATLEGKNAELNVYLTVAFPQIFGSSSFIEKELKSNHSAKITFAPPGAGSIYSDLWGGGVFLGGLAAMTAGLILVLRAKWARRSKVQLFPIT